MMLAVIDPQFIFRIILKIPGWFSSRCVLLCIGRCIELSVRCLIQTRHTLFHMHIGKTDHDTWQNLMNCHLTFSSFIGNHHDHAVFIFYDRFVLLPNWAISRFKNRNSPNDGLPAKRRNIFRSWKQI